MADYFFRDDIEAEKDRQAELQKASATTTLAPAPPPAPKAAAAPTGQNVYSAIGAASQPAGPANGFQDFANALDAQDPFKAQVKGAVTDTLANPAQAADEAAGLTRDRLAKSQQVEAERRRQQAGLAYGGGQTGQVARVADDYAAEAALERQDVEGQLRAERMTAIERNRAAAIGQGSAILGQESQERLGQKQLDVQQQESGLDRALEERLASEGINLDREKFQAADANQKRGLSIEESAQELERMGMDREDARFYAGLAAESKEMAADRQSRETLVYAQLGSAERLQALGQVYEANQRDLDRSLEKLLSNDRISAQFQLADLDRTFQERMQTSGFVQEKDMQAMRADLEKNLQATGIDAEVAKQIADQKFTEMMTGRDQAFEEKMTSIKQAWATGERVSTQDWDSAMQTMDHVQEEKMAKLESMLRLDEAGNAQTFQTAFQKMQNDFTLFRDEQGYSHEDATRMATEAFQQKLMEAGFDQETAMQASRLAHDVSEGQKDRASAEMMSAAQLAQADDHFMQEIQQRYQFNDQDMEIRKQELGAQMKLMGLQGQQLEAALQNDKVQNAMNIVALGMEMGDGSPESMAPFVEQFGSALETYFKAQGIDIAGSDFVKSLTPKPATTSGSIQRTETGAITPGQTVAGIDLATATRPQMQALLGDPANPDKLIKAGAIRQVSSIGELSNMEEATQAFARLGLSGNIAETSKSGATQGMTFKPQTYIYYNGKPYELSGFVTGPFGVGVLKGIDLTTGKETTIKTH